MTIPAHRDRGAAKQSWFRLSNMTILAHHDCGAAKQSWFRLSNMSIPAHDDVEGAQKNLVEGWTNGYQRPS